MMMHRLSSVGLLIGLLLLLRSAAAKEPWEELPPDPMPEKIEKPPPWLTPFLNTRAQGLHNNLPELAKTVASQDNWVTMFAYNYGVRDFFLNCGSGQHTQHAARIASAACTPALATCGSRSLCYQHARGPAWLALSFRN